MKKLYKKYENDKSIFLSCEEISGAEVFLQGRDSLFNYEVIEKISNNILLSKERYSKYNRLRVVYIKNIDSKDIILDVSNDISFDNKGENILKNIEVFAVDSYKGISISFRSIDLYDKYFLYEKTKDGLSLIMETSDFQITSDIFNKNKIYYVEGLLKKDDNYYVAGKSKEFTISTKKFPLKKKKKLSIIVPVFNGENFVPRTIDSILLSSYDDFELILVNDGSKDNTLKILKWYEKKYSFIKCINKEWSGPSETRNIGFEQVNTDYTGYIDSDDLVHPYMYQILMDNAIKEDADISIGKTLIINDNEPNTFVLQVNCGPKEYVKYDYNKMFEEYRKNSFANIFFVSACNKVAKTEIMKKVKFPRSNYYEDNAYTPTLYSFANNFVFSERALYIWDKRKRNTEGTHSTSYSRDKNANIIEEYINALNYTYINGNQDRKDYILYQAVVYLSNYYKNIKSNKEFSKKYFNTINNIIGRKNILNNKLLRESEGITKEFLKDFM